MSGYPRHGIRVFAASLLLCVGALSQLNAQQNATLSGTVMDQTGKGIPNATIELRSATTQTRSLTSNDDGKFSASDVVPGNYTIVVAAGGFALATRPGAQVNAGGTLDIAITLSVESVAVEVTVNETISIAAITAPSGNRLEATAAKTEITQDFIRNFMSPLADYAEVVNFAPGTYSINPNGIGLG